MEDETQRKMCLSWWAILNCLGVVYEQGLWVWSGVSGRGGMGYH